MIDTGGYQVGRVVALFLDATRNRGARSGLDTRHMSEVILNDEERRGMIAADSLPPKSQDNASFRPSICEVD